MEKKKVIIIGSSGHAKVIIDIFEKMGNYQIVGLLDAYRAKGETTLGYKILGSENDLQQLILEHGSFELFIGIGDNSIREKVAEKVQGIMSDVAFANAIHPSAQLANSVELGKGIAIMAGAIVNSSSQLGDFSIVNTKASLDHDCHLGAFASLGPNATTGGNVKIGRSSVLGISATVKHNVSIGSQSIIGGNAFLLKDCGDNEIWFGNPATFIKNRSAGDKYL